jgi:hypothetical protein
MFLITLLLLLFSMDTSLVDENSMPHTCHLSPKDLESILYPSIPGNSIPSDSIMVQIPTVHHCYNNNGCKPSRC